MSTSDEATRFGRFQACGRNVNIIMISINSMMFRRKIPSIVLFLLHNITMQPKPRTSRIASIAGSRTAMLTTIDT